MIKEIIAKLRKKDERFNELQAEDKAFTKVQERKKTANERELERYLEEERQERISKELSFRRKKQQHDLWKGNVMKSPNIFRGGKKPLSGRGGL